MVTLTCPLCRDWPEVRDMWCCHLLRLSEASARRSVWALWGFKACRIHPDRPRGMLLTPCVLLHTGVLLLLIKISQIQTGSPVIAFWNLPLIITHRKAAVNIRTAETNGKLDFFHWIREHDDPYIDNTSRWKRSGKVFRTVGGNGRQTAPWCRLACCKEECEDGQGERIRGVWRWPGREREKETERKERERISQHIRGSRLTPLAQCLQRGPCSILSLSLCFR